VQTDLREHPFCELPSRVTPLGPRGSAYGSDRYLWWAGYVTMLPTSMAYTDPAVTAQTLELARWFLAHAPDLTLLVPLPNDENLSIPSR
jgi:hypothetical protein